MAIQILGTTVIDNSRNGTNIVSVTATNFSGKGSIPASTVLYFFQASAPTNFTKLTTNNDITLRVVSGSGGGSGGVTAFSSVFPSAGTTPLSVTGTIGATTLTTPQIPAHTHARSLFQGPGNGAPNVGSMATPVPLGDTGGSQSHDHPFGSPGGGTIDLRVQYVDVIACSRDA